MLRMAPMAHWLLKSEPDVFGYDDLVAARREPWDGIRNYQSRNHLRAMRKGDEAIFYHSSTNPPGAAGICKIVKEAEPDPTQFDPMAKYYDPASKPDDPRWDIVTVAPVRKLNFVPLDELRDDARACRLTAAGQRQPAVGAAVDRRGVRSDRRRRLAPALISPPSSPRNLTWSRRPTLVSMSTSGTVSPAS